MTAFGMLLEQVRERGVEAATDGEPRASVRELAPADAATRLLRRLEHRALTDGEWWPYLSHLRVRARHYVRERVAFRQCFSMLTPSPALVLEAMRVEDDPRKLRAVMDGLERFRELVTTALVEVYLHEEWERVRAQERQLLRLSADLQRCTENDQALMRGAASDLSRLLTDLSTRMECALIDAHEGALPSPIRRTLRTVHDRLENAVRLAEVLTATP